MYAGINKISESMINIQKWQDLTAANLAGQQVSGFKGQYARELQRHEVDENNGGNDTITSSLSYFTNFEQGVMKPTNRSLDFAIHGKGFFKVRDANNRELYTRNGSFLLSKDRKLITQQGHELIADNGPITIPKDIVASHITLNKDGTLAATNSMGISKKIDKITLFEAEEPKSLKRLSASYYQAPEDLKMIKDKNSSLINQHLEQANTSPIVEMASMIQSARDFELSQRLIKIATEISQQEQQKLA